MSNCETILQLVETWLLTKVQMQSRVQSQSAIGFSIWVVWPGKLRTAVIYFLRMLLRSTAACWWLRISGHAWGGYLDFINCPFLVPEAKTRSCLMQIMFYAMPCWDDDLWISWSVWFGYSGSLCFYSGKTACDAGTVADYLAYWKTNRKNGKYDHICESCRRDIEPNTLHSVLLLQEW